MEEVYAHRLTPPHSQAHPNVLGESFLGVRVPSKSSILLSLLFNKRIVVEAALVSKTDVSSGLICMCVQSR